MPEAYQLTDGGVRRARDGAYVPNDPANRDWQEYLAWVGAGNTADPAPAPTLAQEKAAAVIVVENEYLRRVKAIEVHAPRRAYTGLLIAREIDRIEGDGSPAPANYPLLAALVPEVGADVSAVATVVRAELDALAIAIAPLEAVRRAGVEAINAAADSAAVAAAKGAVAWP